MASATDHLHKEFRTLTMLLTLVTGLNNQYGHPMLLKSFAERYEGAFERTRSNYSIALNAVAAILVRNYEVIAAHNDQVPSPVNSPLKHLESIDVLTVHDEDWRDEDLEELQHTLSTNFATFANTDHKDDYYDRTFPGHCILANPGTSHLPLMNQSMWYSLKIK
jgi:hypothetical protein